MLELLFNNAMKTFCLSSNNARSKDHNGFYAKCFEEKADQGKIKKTARTTRRTGITHEGPPLRISGEFHTEYRH